MKKINFNIELRSRTIEKLYLDITLENALPFCNKWNIEPNKFLGIIADIKNSNDIYATKSFDLVKVFVQNRLERNLNAPDPNTNRATKAVSLEEQRKYNRIMDAFDDSQDGIVSIEDSDFDFLNENFNNANSPVYRESSEVIVKISDKLIEAKCQTR